MDIKGVSSRFFGVISLHHGNCSSSLHLILLRDLVRIFLTGIFSNSSIRLVHFTSQRHTWMLAPRYFGVVTIIAFYFFSSFLLPTMALASTDGHAHLRTACYHLIVILFSTFSPFPFYGVKLFLSYSNNYSVRPLVFEIPASTFRRTTPQLPSLWIWA